MLWSEQRFTSCLLGNGVCSFPPPLLPVRISIPNEVRNSVPVSLWRASMMTVQTNWTGTLLCHKHADVEWMSGSKTLSALRNKKGHVLQWIEQNSMRNLRFNKNPFDDFKWNPVSERLLFIMDLLHRHTLQIITHHSNRFYFYWLDIEPLTGNLLPPQKTESYQECFSGFWSNARITLNLSECRKWGRMMWSSEVVHILEMEVTGGLRQSCTARTFIRIIKGWSQDVCLRGFM